MTLANEKVREIIQNGKAVLGIEFGSTRIKAVLVDEENNTIAIGSHEWENQFEEGVWTYSEEVIWEGLRACYSNMAEEVYNQYGVYIENIGAIGFSGMMHGYMPFNKEGQLLVPFRTWRNTITGEASEKLTELLNYHIPQRWSIAHLYQAILNGETHVGEIDFITTLAGYIHWQLTGKKVMGVGEASGMFPIDLETKNYNAQMVAKFNQAIEDKKYAWKLEDILPQVKVAGELGGRLTEEGAKCLDATGRLKAGIPICPPEGDAGTGMVATNSVMKRTGNVSAGTSVFAMIVLEKELSKVYDAIDLVTTPTGELVAMVHCNNCTSDLNSWINMFEEFAGALGASVDKNKLFTVLYEKALEGEPDAGGLLAYNYFSGEHITGFEEGRPLFVRSSQSKLNLANFMRAHLFTALGALKIGLDILMKEEKVAVDEVLGHGGLFKTKGVGQKILAAAINAPVSVMENAGEGGAWGIAVLAKYMKAKLDGVTNRSLEEYLAQDVFVNEKMSKMAPDANDVKGFEDFMVRYKKCLDIESAAVKSLNWSE
ncbi:xylulokinase [Cellulosilyticum ruminicola]|uniref:xylulokinase n=1 Tax=Cellulosilyticum ruminicola TaxID=425254 RepID=UPI0006D285D9|nr:FGGY-family carbohydrate kinase [Cellulosilyticum ruminicola]